MNAKSKNNIYFFVLKYYEIKRSRQKVGNIPKLLEI